MSQRPNIDELLCDYLDGTLDADRQRQLQTLLKRHAKLRKVLDQMQQARGMLRDLPLEKMPAAASAELQGKLRNPASIPLYARPGLLRLAAAIALTITGGLALWAILPATAPSARQTVALDMVVATPAAPAARPLTESLARKDAGQDANRIEAEDSRRAMKGGQTAGAGAADTDADNENEPAVMVVVADDIRGTQRQIRDILASNNISYESVSPPSDVREEASKELQLKTMAKSAPTTPAPMAGGLAAPMPAAPAAPAPAMASKAEATPLAAAASPAGPAAAQEPKEKQDLADAITQQQTGGFASAAAAAGAGPSPDAMQTFARAMETARQANALPQQTATATDRHAAGYYGVIARNVTPDQLGRIRSGLRDASRSRNLRVVDAAAERDNQQTFTRDQTQNQNRAANDYPFQQQAQVQQQAVAPEPRRRVSFSPRYDLTIVVQGEAAAGNAATQANVPVWPVPATQPSSTLPSTAPVQH